MFFLERVKELKRGDEKDVKILEGNFFDEKESNEELAKMLMMPRIHSY